MGVFIAESDITKKESGVLTTVFKQIGLYTTFNCFYIWIDD
jgi:hypothetical protein